MWQETAQKRKVGLAELDSFSFAGPASVWANQINSYDFYLVI